jgi:hypothetical protein
MDCHDGCCEFETKTKRYVRRSATQERYGRLWAELELPRQLLENLKKNTDQEKKAEENRVQL